MSMGPDRCRRCGEELDHVCHRQHPVVELPPGFMEIPPPRLPGIDLAVWEEVDTHAEWSKVPTERAACVAGTYLRLRQTSTEVTGQ